MPKKQLQIAYGKFTQTGEGAFELRVEDEWMCDAAIFRATLTHVERICGGARYLLRVDDIDGARIAEFKVKHTTDDDGQTWARVWGYTGHRFFDLKGAAEDVTRDVVGQMPAEEVRRHVARFDELNP